ncbi:hypothetical protein ACFXKW_00210 [Streptomyces sp. NPDC059193]|uniref:hypothetical protein n=1 Tax=Streptomyces sp. NPDC059193 TaxID=3346763 RepID=UPI003688795D
MVRGWHASLSRDTEPAVDHDTGEVRVPLVLYDVDVRVGDTELVLSRHDVRVLVKAFASAATATDVAGER